MCGNIVSVNNLAGCVIYKIFIGLRVFITLKLIHPQSRLIIYSVYKYLQQRTINKIRFCTLIIVVLFPFTVL